MDKVSVRLRHAGNIRAGVELGELPRVFPILFALADRAESIERLGIDPVRESNWGMVFSHAVILAGEIVEEFETREGTDGSV